MTSSRPIEQPQAKRETWNTPARWVALATIFVLTPVTLNASRAVVDAGVSHWATAAVAAAVAVTSMVLLSNGTGKAKDGVLFGLCMAFTLTAVLDTAKALDVWEGWVMWAAVVPILGVQVLLSHRRGDDSSS